ncbi:uncharacterized protein MYCGRDRAFT_97243 [Zymoseptoria tritici IPO323]|uniref:Retrotransposon gag domain-containing protein n=1 Tax=Zymoseptoria tritici (strain CBS 115943 / IPO323) TaxID=336722 RepID=F9XPK6_ZYMTI|nr:uncharacterized protein MYCGRDRAFT_97243 [Zymoseptoria tritici IPO323]EGP82483.1 hypothetical protein MYCGRDRAFT_97243 [Zymoseptoria tritici IPO323]
MTRAHFDKLLDTKTPNMKARVEKMRAAINTPQIRAKTDEDSSEDEEDELDNLLNSHDEERDVTPTPVHPHQVTTPTATPLRPLRVSSSIPPQPEFRGRTPYRALIADKKQQQRAPSPVASVLSEFGTTHKHKKVMFEKPDKWHRDKDKDTMLFTEWKQKINKHFQYESSHYTNMEHCIDACVAQTSGLAWKKLQPRVNTSGFKSVAEVLELLTVFYGKHYKDSYIQRKFWSLKLAENGDLDDFLSEFDECAMYVDQNPEQEAYHLTRAVKNSRFGQYLIRRSFTTAEEMKSYLRRIDIDLNRQKANDPSAAASGNRGGSRTRNNKAKDKSQPERSLLSSMNYSMTKAYD